MMLSEGIYVAMSLAVFAISKVLHYKQRETLVIGLNVLREMVEIGFWGNLTYNDNVSSDIYTHTDLLAHIASFGVSVFSLMESRHNQEQVHAADQCVENMMCAKDNHWD